MTIQSQGGQSMYDIACIVFGGIDTYAAFIRQNNIDDLNYVPTSPTVFTYNTSFSLVSDYAYTTVGETESRRALLTANRLRYLLTSDRGQYLIE